MSRLTAVLLLSLASVAGAAPPQRSSIHPDVLAGMFVAFDSRANGDAYAELPKLDAEQRQGAVKKLTAFLKDKHPEARAKACGALGALGPKASAVPALIKLLEQDDNRHVRASAAAALGRAVPPTKESAGALAAAVAGDEELDVRVEGVKALKALGLSAAAPLGEAAAIKAKIPGLIRKLGGDDDAKRLKAAVQLWKIGDMALPALSAAVEKAEVTIPHGAPRPARVDIDPKTLRTAQEAATVLYAIGQDPSGKLYRGKIPHPNEELWMKAQRVLVSGDALPLLRALESPFPATRRLAAFGLGYPEIADSDEVLAALVKALSDDAKAVRSSAASTLQSKKQLPDQAVPALLTALRGGKTNYNEVIDLLYKISRDKKNPQPLISALTSFPEGRRSTVESLGRMGADAKDAVPHLIPLLAAGQPHELRCETADALGRIGPAAAGAQPTLEKLVEDKTPASPTGPGYVIVIRKGIISRQDKKTLGDLAKDALRDIRARH